MDTNKASETAKNAAATTDAAKDAAQTTNAASGAQGTTDANGAADTDKSKLPNTQPPAGGDDDDNDEPSVKEIKKALTTLKKEGIVHVPASQKAAFEEAIKADDRFAESSWGTNTTDEQTAFRLNR